MQIVRILEKMNRTYRDYMETPKHIIDHLNLKWGVEGDIYYSQSKK